MSHVDDGQLNTLLDGELPEAAAKAVDTHLAVCAACRLRYDEARQFLAQAAELLGALEPPAAKSVVRTAAGAAAAGTPAGAEPPRRVSKTAKEVAVDIDGSTQKSPAIRQVFPREVERHAPLPEAPPAPAGRPPRIDITTLAWAASIVLALGVGYLAREVRLARREVMTLAAAGPDTAAPAAPARAAPPTSPAAEASRPARATSQTARPRPVAVKSLAARGTKPLPPDAAADAAALGARPSTTGGIADRRQAAGAGAPGIASAGAAPAQNLATTAPPPAVVGRVAPAAPAPTSQPRAAAEGARDAAGAPAFRARAADRTPEARAAEPLNTFRRATTDEAVRRLGGTIRLLDGMFSDHIEVGPGHLVSGADPNHDVVRVVYTDAQGRRLTLEEQRLLLPADTSTAARLTYLMNAVGMTWGDTLVTAAPSGTARIRWIDRKNFWVSLTGSMPPDSLRVMLERIR